MDVRSPLFQNIACVLIGVLFLNPIVATAAQLTVDAQAGGNTSLGQAGNGVPIVNIATPSGSGLSHNKFSDYNVGQQGLILNNATARTQATQLGGLILGNPNLGGQAAGVILNEVTGANASQLRGYTEVAGQSAHVIVANPHGISCDGCGFLNTPRATLSTGKPQVENGRLQRFDVDGGQIRIEGAGLNAGNVDQFDLITRSATLNAELHANQLNIVTGRNQVDADSLAATAKAPAAGDVPALAIDSSALGGMYAGAIRLVGTEAGVGVKLAGDLAASAGDLSISSDGQLTVGKAFAQGNATLQAQDIELTDDVHANGNLRAEAHNELNNAKTLSAGGDLILVATDVYNNGALEAGFGAEGDSNPASVLRVESDYLENDGRITAQGQLQIETDELWNRNGEIVSGQHGQINAGEFYNQNGKLLGQSALTVSTATLDNRAGTIASNQALHITASDSLDNRNDGLLLSKAQGLSVTTQQLSNRGGVIQANTGALQLTASEQLDNRDGKLLTGQGEQRIDSHSLLNQQGVIRANGGAINLTSARLDNQQGSVQGDSLNLRASEQLDNTDGYLASSVGDQQLHTAELLNQGGTLLAKQQLRLDADSLDNRSGQIGAATLAFNLGGRLENQNGLIEASEGFDLALGTLDNASGRLRALGQGGSSHLSSSGLLYNSEGLIEVGNARFELAASDLLNGDGQVRHLGNEAFLFDWDAVGAAGGSFMTNADLSLTAASWYNSSWIQANRFSLDVGSFRQEWDGRLLAVDGMNLRGEHWDNDGRIASDGHLDLNLGGKYQGFGSLQSLADMTLSAGDLEVGEAAELRSGADAVVRVSGLLENWGNLTAGQALDLAAGQLDNHVALGASGQLRIATPLLNNRGLLFSGADMALYLQELRNTGNVFSLGSLDLAADETLSPAGLLENLSGTLESQGDMRLRVASLVNDRLYFQQVRKQLAGSISVTCYDCSGDHHNVDYVGREQFETQIIRDSGAAHIHSGGDLNIQGTAVRNLKSVLSAAGDIEIDAATLDNLGVADSRIERVRTFNTGRVTDGTDERFRANHINPYNASALPKEMPQALYNFRLVSDIETQTPTGPGAAAIIQAGGNVSILASQAIDNDSILANQAPAGGAGQDLDTQVAGASDPLVVRLNAQLPPDERQRAVDPLNLPGFSLPQEKDGLFRLTTTPGHLYLVETNPALTSLKQFLNSDYLLAQLGYDPTQAQKRLGDGLYEQRLLREAIVARTGQRFLAGLNSDEAIFRHLMDNAIASKDALRLSLGVSLTAEQVAALTHDIVWMEERQVMGQSVLVPVLYLAQANNRLAPSGALIQGQDVALISGSNLNNSGTLRASQSLSATANRIDNSGLMQADERIALLATDSIRNARGGIINGKDVSAIALTGDIANERTITQESRSGKGFSQLTSVVDSAAGIEASNDLSLSSGRDIRNIGGTLKAGGNAELSAGGDLIIAAAEAENGQMRKDKRHFWSNSSTTQYGSEVQVGGNLAAEAGADLAVIASQVKAAGDIALQAGGDAVIAAAANQSSSEYRYKGNGKKINQEDSTVRQQAAEIQAGGDLLIVAERDVALSASRLEAGGEAYLYAGEQLNLLAAQDSDYHLYDYKKKGAWGSKKTQRDETTSVRHVGSEIKTGGDLTLASGGDQLYQAARLASGADLTLDSGGAITFEGVKDLEQESHEKSKGDAFWNSMKGKGSTDETLRQSQLIAAGELTIKAVDGLKIDIKEVNQHSVSQTIDAMVAADPQLAWLKQAEARGDVDWRRVKEIHDSFKYEHSGLGPASQLIIAIAMAVIVGPMAVGLGVSGQAVAVSVATNATVSTINNRGNLGAVVKDVTSSDAIKGYVVAAATAGVADKLGYNPSELGFNAESVKTVALKTLVDSTIKTAVYGGSFKDNLGDAAVGAAVSIGGAVGANQIGNTGLADGSLPKIALHAALGGLMAEAMGGDFRTGALAAGANEALVAYLGDKLLPAGKDKSSPEYKQGVANLLAASQVIGVLAAVVADGDVGIGAAVAANATQHNYLNHSDARDFVREMEACNGDASCQGKAWKQFGYDELSLENLDRALKVGGVVVARDHMGNIAAGLDALTALNCTTSVCEMHKLTLMERAFTAYEKASAVAGEFEPSLTMLAMGAGAGRLPNRAPGSTPALGSASVQKAVDYFRTAKSGGGKGNSAAGDFFAGTKYTDKVLGQIKTGDLHAFPESVKAFQEAGQITKITGGDGVVRDMLKIPGKYRGKQGVFEFIKEPDGSINHRLFKPNPGQ